MNNLLHVQEAIKKCRIALSEDPNYFPLQVIIKKLQYIYDYNTGKLKDINKLKDLKIGWIAVREMDGYEDRDLIRALCVISKETDDLVSKELNTK